MKPVHRHSFALSPFLLCAFATPAAAAVCSVPSASHPTIQAAVDDAACTEIVVGVGTYVESVEIQRSLSITGDSASTTVIEGGVSATGAGVELTLDELRVDAGASSVAGCFPIAVDVSDGAALTSNNLIAVNADGDACLIFRDGFETGGTGAWSATSP
jgi:pectin methylesterase-like acyl-CoA thioesterase